MLKRFFIWLYRFLLGCLWLVLSEVLVVSLYRVPPQFPDETLALAFGYGFMGGGVLFCKFRLVPVYVLGHELTHWLIAKLFRRKTSKFTLHLSSGSVRVERPNIWIVLGPYIFPFYMLLFMACYFPFAFFLSLTRGTVLGCAGVMGMLYAYHLVLTFVALANNQPDMTFNGKVYSLVFILFFNLLFIFLGMTLSTQAFMPCVNMVWEVLCGQASAVRKLIWWNSLVI